MAALRRFLATRRRIATEKGNHVIDSPRRSSPLERLAESYYARKLAELRERPTYRPQERERISEALGRLLESREIEWLARWERAGGCVLLVESGSKREIIPTEAHPRTVPVEQAARRELGHRHGATSIDDRGRMRGVSPAEAMVNFMTRLGGGLPPKQTAHRQPDGRVTHRLEPRKRPPARRWRTVLPRPTMRRESRPAPVRSRGSRRGGAESRGPPGDGESDPEPVAASPRHYWQTEGAI